MSITEMTIKGYRGFATDQRVRFAMPTGRVGSGLTVLVGPNNGGKSSVIEALHALTVQRAVSFSEGKRNKAAGDQVKIIATTSDGEHSLRTASQGGSETVRSPDGSPLARCCVLPSRRFFSPYFDRGEWSRNQYVHGRQVPSSRSAAISGFNYRLFKALGQRDEFNRVLARVVDPPPEWTIEQSDQGNHYIKVNEHGQYHNSDGLGEGIISLLFIVDALYDSDAGDIVAIDEPELSLHPVYQRRLGKLLGDYATDRQIIYATHSPYFVNFKYILSGAEIARIHKRGGGSEVSHLAPSTAARCAGLLDDTHNPHVLGLDARETFFQEDGVIVVEGQEDAVYYPKVLDQLVQGGELLDGSRAYLEERIFGWGAGGAAKVETISTILHDLGFERVVGILDNNQQQVAQSLRSTIPDYDFHCIPADDVRTKRRDSDGRETVGLLDDNQLLRPCFREELVTIFSQIEAALRGKPAQQELGLSPS